MLHIFCADIGSEARGRFGWAGISAGRSTEVEHGTSLDSLADAVAQRFQRGPVALGFECPLFVPIADQPRELTRARVGEGARAWCAGAGAGALATGIPQVIWLLRRIRTLVEENGSVYVDWPQFRQNGQGLFLWEAFVTGTAKVGSHCDDAETAVRMFAASLPNPMTVNSITSAEIHSLIGAALLRTGWSEDLGLLATPCLVLKA